MISKYAPNNSRRRNISGTLNYCKYSGCLRRCIRVAFSLLTIQQSSEFSILRMSPLEIPYNEETDNYILQNYSKDASKQTLICITTQNSNTWFCSVARQEKECHAICIPTTKVTELRRTFLTSLTSAQVPCTTNEMLKVVICICTPRERPQ